MSILASKRAVISGENSFSDAEMRGIIFAKLTTTYTSYLEVLNLSTPERCGKCKKPTLFFGRNVAKEKLCGGP